MSNSSRVVPVSPSLVPGLVATAAVAYAVHTAAWILHQLEGGATWPRWLELTYPSTLVVWVGALLLTRVIRSRLRKAAGRAVLGDERTAVLFTRAHQVALVVVVLVQIPFFVLSIPAQALAQLTITTAIVALFVAYTWLDR